MRRPGEHLALAPREPRLALRPPGEELAQALKGVERHEMEAGRRLRCEVDIRAGHRHSSLIAAHAMDRDDEILEAF